MKPTDTRFARIMACQDPALEYVRVGNPYRGLTGLHGVRGNERKPSLADIVRAGSILVRADVKFDIPGKFDARKNPLVGRAERFTVVSLCTGRSRWVQALGHRATLIKSGLGLQLYLHGGGRCRPGKFPSR